MNSFISYIPNLECISLGDGGICNCVLSGEFEVLINHICTFDEPWDVEKKTIKPTSLCPFAGEPSDPKEKYCKHYEHSVGGWKPLEEENETEKKF